MSFKSPVPSRSTGKRASIDQKDFAVISALSRNDLTNLDSSEYIPRRMEWLSDMICDLACDHDFNDNGRAWFRNKVANEDMAKRRGRQNSLFWEFALKSNPTIQTIGLEQPVLYGAGSYGHANSPRSTSPKVNNGAPSAEKDKLKGRKAGGSVTDRPAKPKSSDLRSAAVGAANISLEDVLTDPNLRTDFQAHLEDNFTSQYLEFLMQVQKWKEKYFGIRNKLTELSSDDSTKGPGPASSKAKLSAKDKSDVKLLSARKIYSRYVDENKTEGDAVVIANDVKAKLKATLGILDRNAARQSISIVAQKGGVNLPLQEDNEIDDDDTDDEDTDTEDELVEARKSNGRTINAKNKLLFHNVNNEIPELLANSFTASCAAVLGIMKEQLWPYFLDSDEFQNLCEERLADEVERKQRDLLRENLPPQPPISPLSPPPTPAPTPSQPTLSVNAATNTSGELSAGSSGRFPALSPKSSSGPSNSTSALTSLEMSIEALGLNSDEIAPGGVFGGSKPAPWYNIDGWKSVTVDILDCRYQKKETKLYFLISADSKTLKTQPELLMFKDHVEFELLNTTQFVEVSVWSAGSFGKMLGICAIPICRVVKQQIAALEAGKKEIEPVWAKLQPIQGSEGAAIEMLLRVELSHKVAGSNKNYSQIFESDNQNTALADAIRGKVSKKKKRFQVDGFDLDLSYVTDRIIAMGYPSEGTEGVYRNHMKNVQRFFDRRHPKAFRLYNLCSERSYEASKFYGSVHCFPFDDHNPCEFEVTKKFCENLRQWLGEHPQNVAAIHCKAGKGRTGTMIACYLVYINAAPTAEQALQMFAEKRTQNKKGVTIPSQIRYVHYFQKYCELKRLKQLSPGPCTLFLHGFILHTVPKHAVGSEEDIFFKFTPAAVINNKDSTEKGFNSLKHIQPYYDKERRTISMDLSKKLFPLSEDCKFEFAFKTALGKQKLFQFWLNTRYIVFDYIEDNLPRLALNKTKLDKACKDVKHKNYSPEFKLEIIFQSSNKIIAIKEKELTIDANSLNWYYDNRDKLMANALRQ
jgi:phosphatidylinositol-3,4,5-trisphosphate 3-phosphatase/dual-specificity protein phosphatase PTEN